MKIGIFGGAFNPVHLAHKEICEIAIKNCSLDRIVLLPSYNAPHKGISLDFDTRVEMLKIAFTDSGYICETIEKNFNNKKSYTSDIIPFLKNKYGDDLYFIIGSDSMLDFAKWKDPQYIVQEMSLIVIKRNGEDDVKDIINKYQKLDNARKIRYIEQMPMHISSSELRIKLLANEDCTAFMDRQVLDYIKKNRLFTDYDDILEHLRLTISADRYAHTLRVAQYALKLNEYLKIDENKVITAALLHDCCKSNQFLTEYFNKHPEESITKEFYNAGKISPIAHAFVAAEFVQGKFNIKDEEILDAIKYHTTGRACMGRLEKLIYAADSLEYGREEKRLEKIRKIIEVDFDSGFKELINSVWDYLQSKSTDIYYLSKNAYEFYVLNN